MYNLLQIHLDDYTLYPKFEHKCWTDLNPRSNYLCHLIQISQIIGITASFSISEMQSEMSLQNSLKHSAISCQVYTGDHSCKSTSSNLVEPTFQNKWDKYIFDCPQVGSSLKYYFHKWGQVHPPVRDLLDGGKKRFVRPQVADVQLKTYLSFTDIFTFYVMLHVIQLFRQTSCKKTMKKTCRPPKTHTHFCSISIVFAINNFFPSNNP